MKRLIHHSRLFEEPDHRKFTFQYEKINTRRPPTFPAGSLRFTFQYEKINTLVAEIVPVLTSDLHSNMKRLIPIAFFALSLKRYFAIICRPF